MSQYQRFISKFLQYKKFYDQWSSVDPTCIGIHQQIHGYLPSRSLRASALAHRTTMGLHHKGKHDHPRKWMNVTRKRGTMLKGTVIQASIFRNILLSYQGGNLSNHRRFWFIQVCWTLDSPKSTTNDLRNLDIANLNFKRKTVWSKVNIVPE